MNRTKWILLAVTALVILGALFAALYFALWAPPSKQDFTEAKADAQKIAAQKASESLRSYALAVSDSSRAGKQGTELAAAGSEHKKATLQALAERMNLAKNLQDSRVLRDEEVKAAYDIYWQREQKYSRYVQGYAESFPVFSSSLKTCGKVFTATRDVADPNQFASKHTEVSKDCLTDLGALDKTTIPPYAEYAKTMRSVVVDRQKAFDDLASSKITVRDLTARIKKANEPIATIDPSSKVATFAKESFFNGELNKLIALLDKKAQKA